MVNLGLGFVINTCVNNYNKFYPVFFRFWEKDYISNEAQPQTDETSRYWILDPRCWIIREK